MLLFFDDHITAEDQNFTFDRSESKHISRVLRKETGAIVTLTNGKGLEWSGKIILISPQKVEAEKLTIIQHPISENHINLAIAPIKSNNRMEWLVEKITELGVSSITPILCERSERKVINTIRLNKIAVTALKQSQQFYLPEINPLISFKKYVNNLQSPGLIAHCQSSPKTLLNDYILKSKKINLFVGPEGDFTPKEIEIAASAGLLPVSLGKNRLRTETAGLLGCHTLFMKL